MDNKETEYTLYAVEYDLFSCLKVKDKQNGLKFKIWQNDDDYYEAELINKQKFSLWNMGKTYQSVVDQISQDIVDIWKHFVECELEELSEDAIEFRNFIKDNFEMDRCDG